MRFSTSWSSIMAATSMPFSLPDWWAFSTWLCRTSVTRIVEKLKTHSLYFVHAARLLSTRHGSTSMSTSRRDFAGGPRRSHAGYFRVPSVVPSAYRRGDRRHLMSWLEDMRMQGQCSIFPFSDDLLPVVARSCIAKLPSLHVPHGQARGQHAGSTRGC